MGIIDTVILLMFILLIFEVFITEIIIESSGQERMADHTCGNQQLQAGFFFVQELL